MKDEDECHISSEDVSISDDLDLALRLDKEPEGGTRAWLNVFGSVLVFFASYGVINSFGFFQSYYQLIFLSNYRPSTIAFIGSLQVTLLSLTAVAAGALFDAYGVKYLYPIAGLAASGSLLALSFTTPNHIWQQFLAQSLLFGIGVAFGVQPAMTIVGQYFNKRRALVMGIVASGSSVGGVVLPIMFKKLIPVIGFPWTMRVGALIMVVSYAAAMCVSSARLPTRPMKSVGQLLDFRGFLDKRYAVLCVGYFVAILGLYVPYYYIEPFCLLLDPNTNIKGYLLPIINGSSFLGRILGGYMADKLGRLNVLYPMTLLSGTLCLALWFPAHHPSLIIGFVSLYGFSSGVLISVIPAAVGQITPAEKLGARIGAFGSVTSVAYLTGAPIAGALIRGNTRIGYQPLVAFAGCTLLIGGAIMFVSRLLHTRDMNAKW